MGRSSEFDDQRAQQPTSQSTETALSWRVTVCWRDSKGLDWAKLLGPWNDRREAWGEFHGATATKWPEDTVQVDLIEQDADRGRTRVVESWTVSQGFKSEQPAAVAPPGRQRDWANEVAK